MSPSSGRSSAGALAECKLPGAWGGGSPPLAGGASVLGLIGNTPLLPLRRLGSGLEGSEVWAKAEWYNPGGSVKDRAALAMIEEGERRGALGAGRVILDATSGNTGIAYALIGAVKGYPVHLFVPGAASAERRRILQALGAEVTYTDPLEGSDGAIVAARGAYEGAPDRYFMPDQYNNPANWRAHYETTGKEIWEQTGGAITHFVAAVGTSGTLMGTGRRLRELKPGVKVIAVEPAESLHGLEGLKHMASCLVPGIYDPTFPDATLRVRTEEAYAMVRRLAREEGLLVGLSSGANCWAALEVAAAEPGSFVVTVLPDSGERYLTAAVWDGGAPGAAGAAGRAG